MQVPTLYGQPGPRSRSGRGLELEIPPVSREGRKGKLVGLGSQSKLAVTLRIYNYAGLSDDALAGAEAAASSIFQRAGIETVWLDCPRDQSESGRYPVCESAFGPRDFVVRLASRSMAESLPLPSDTFGFGLPCANRESACYADVFSHRVTAFAADEQINEPKLMGHVLAHEIGHLLLGPNSHGPAGIMQARWDEDQIEAMRRAGLAFTAGESRRMRENVRLRANQETVGAGAVEVAARAK